MTGPHKSVKNVATAATIMPQARVDVGIAQMAAPSASRAMVTIHLRMEQ
jgi:hypothetical protein